MAPAAPDLIVGWLLFVSLALTAGAVVGHWFVLPPACGMGAGGPDAPGEASGEGPGSVARLREAAARLGRCGAALLIVALLLVFLRQLVEFRDPFEAWGAEAKLLLGGTPWGRSWVLAGAGAVAAMVAFHLAARAVSGAWAVAGAATLALGTYPAFTGHANSGHLSTLTLFADTLHVWAAGGWMGGLALVLLLERGYRRAMGRGEGRGPGTPTLLPLLVPRFSRLAIACVATLALTGSFASWVHLGSMGALVGSTYGRTLILKLVLVAGALGLGALNSRVLTPRLGNAGGAAAMRRAATVELVVGNVVLAVTAVLVRTPPP